MNSIPYLLFVCICFAGCIQTENKAPQTEASGPDLFAQITEPNVAYDSTLATKLQADEYGMAQYVMAFLKAGPNRSQDSLTAANLQKAHLANITRMAEEGKLVLAGPFMDDGEVRGIYIFNVKTVEEARTLTATDPAIQAGRLVMELHPWYGSAVLPLIVPLHHRLEKTKI
ncbi:MAG: hypothetical protein IPK76_27000 [Lewinellaceae bacterium]|jgi:uncharacterized protein YciI|nr:hypothetical protein [Lewinellaceae bacterium]